MSGTISILCNEDEVIPDEAICPYECDGGDVCVDTKTGICKVCKRVFTIHPTQIIVKT